MNESVNSHVQQAQAAWKKMADDHRARVEAAFAEAARVEAAGLEQAASAIDHLASLQKDTLSYVAKLGEEWRKLSLEAMKMTTDFGAKG